MRSLANFQAGIAGGANRVIVQIRHAGHGHVRIADGLDFFQSVLGNDSVIFSYGSDSYSITGKDSVLDISSVWKEAEFNVVGNAGGSRADFNSGSSIEVTLGLSDGSAAAPSCLANGGTTGETNNLNLGTCSTWTLFGTGGIQFKESN